MHCKIKETIVSLIMLRKERGLTSKEVAEQVGISQGHYSHIENGERSMNPEHAEKLAAVLGVDTTLVIEKVNEAIEKRGKLNHWLSSIKYRGDSLPDRIVKELRFYQFRDKQDDFELIHLIAEKAGMCVSEEIKYDFEKDKELVNYFRKKLE